MAVREFKHLNPPSYKEGLDPILRTHVVGHRFTSYADVVERALKIEASLGRTSGGQNQMSSGHSHWKFKHFKNRRTCPYHISSVTVGSRPQFSWQQAILGGTRNSVSNAVGLDTLHRIIRDRRKKEEYEKESNNGDWNPSWRLTWRYSTLSNPSFVANQSPMSMQEKAKRHIRYCSSPILFPCQYQRTRSPSYIPHWNRPFRNWHLLLSQGTLSCRHLQWTALMGWFFWLQIVFCLQP